MKVRLEKDGAQLVATRFGRVVFVTHPHEPESETGYFDDSAAQAGLDALRDRYVSQGWVELKAPPPPPPEPVTPWDPTVDGVMKVVGPVMSPAARALLMPLLQHGVLSVGGGELRLAFDDDDACSPIDLDLRAFYVFDPRTGHLCLNDDGVFRVDTDDAVEVYLREVHLRLHDAELSPELARIVALVGQRYTWRLKA